MIISFLMAFIVAANRPSPVLEHIPDCRLTDRLQQSCLRPPVQSNNKPSCYTENVWVNGEKVKAILCDPTVIDVPENDKYFKRAASKERN